MNNQGPHKRTSHNFYSALETVNDRLESLALIINQMTDNPGFYAKQPVTQIQIDQFFTRR